MQTLNEENIYIKKLTSFARRVGKGFNNNHKKFLLENDKFLLNLPLSFFENLNETNIFNNELEKKYNLNDYIKNAEILEIGSGDGENLKNLCMHFSNHKIIAAEVFLSGIVQSIKKINELNYKIFADDVNLLLEKYNNIKKHKLQEIFILFPDPWHKNRQKKRRLLQKEFIEKLLRILNNGNIWIATDHSEYANFIKENIELLDKNIYKNFIFDCTPPQYYKPTKYHNKDMAQENKVTWINIIK